MPVLEAVDHESKFQAGVPLYLSQCYVLDELKFVSVVFCLIKSSCTHQRLTYFLCAIGVLDNT